MKQIFKYIFILFVFTNSLYAQVDFSNDKNIPERPSPPKLVNDFAKLFPDYNTFQLENKLVAYNDSTSTQIVVVTVETLNGYAEDDYSLRLGRKWGIGQKGKNNGILILIAKEERAVNIELGYGIEGYISDGDAKRLIENVMIPNFRNGNYFVGVDAATNDIIAMLQGTYKADATPATNNMGLAVIVAFVLIFVLIFIIASKTKGGGNDNGTYTGSRGGWTTGPTLGGGWSGGGGFGGGSSSGGFGGFGGGSFGGGGASGRW